MKKLSTIEKLILSESLYSERRGIVSRTPRLYSKAMTDEEKKTKIINISNIDWSVDKAESLESLESKYKKLIKILEYISYVPSPVGNPASAAIVGKNFAEGKYVEGFLSALGALPMTLALINLAKSPSWVRTLLTMAGALGITRYVKPAILWVGNAVKNINVRKTLELFRKDAKSYAPIVEKAAGNTEAVRTIDQYIQSIGQTIIDEADKIDKELNPPPPTAAYSPAVGVAKPATPAPTVSVEQQQLNILRLFISDYKKNKGVPNVQLLDQLSVSELQKMIKNPSKYGLSSSPVFEKMNEIDMAQLAIDEKT